MPITSHRSGGAGCAGIREIRAGFFRGVWHPCSDGRRGAGAGSEFFAAGAAACPNSLKAVAQQTGQNILFTPQAVAGIIAPELRGQMSGRDAVNVLLKGTNLEADPDGNGGLIVRAAQRAARQEPRGRASGRLASRCRDKGRRRRNPPIARRPRRARAQSAPCPQPWPRHGRTGHRQRLAHFDRRLSAPTPVTMVGAEQLRRDAYTDIGDAIRAACRHSALSSAPTITVARQLHRQRHAGIDVVNLRNLGVTAHPGPVRWPARGGVQRSAAASIFRPCPPAWCSASMW